MNHTTSESVLPLTPDCSAQISIPSPRTNHQNQTQAYRSIGLHQSSGIKIILPLAPAVSVAQLAPAHPRPAAIPKVEVTAPPPVLPVCPIVLETTDPTTFAGAVASSILCKVAAPCDTPPVPLLAVPLVPPIPPFALQAAIPVPAITLVTPPAVPVSPAVPAGPP